MFLKAWRAFTAWRRGRPFWAGLFVAVGAVIILSPPFATLKFGDMVISINTLGGVSALLIGAVLLACAVALWVAPRFRLAAGIVTVLLSLVAVVVSNLGGFVVGTLSCLLGGALAVAWTTEPKKPKAAKRNDGAEPEQTQRVQPT